MATFSSDGGNNSLVAGADNDIDGFGGNDFLFGGASVAAPDNIWVI